MVRQRTQPMMPAPGTPGAPDLVTHLLRDHGLGFYTDPPVRSRTPDGHYDLRQMETDHAAHHATSAADHDHDWSGRSRRSAR